MTDTPKRSLSPVSLAVFVSLTISALILAVVVAIGGSYALTLGAIHRANVASAELHLREETAQIRAAVPTCRSIDRMDKASHIPRKDFPQSPHNIYDKRLSSAIHTINVNSHCPLILHDVATHVPFTEILRQIQNEGPSANRNSGATGGH